MLFLPNYQIPIGSPHALRHSARLPTQIRYEMDLLVCIMKIAFSEKKFKIFRFFTPVLAFVMHHSLSGRIIGRSVGLLALLSVLR